MLAALSDALSFGFTFTGPVEMSIDALTAVALFALLGFRPGLLIPLVIEAIPGLSSFPTWTLAVGAFMALEKPVSSSDKILNRDALAKAVSELKAKGKKVVFTNGVFDLLHVGHLRYLKQACALGDVLVIGLNADSCVKRLKGENRPILPEAERAELLAGLDCVDYVCIFEEDDPRELIKAIVPNILVKGGDWPIDQILGRDTVEAAGGKVLSLPFVEGRSTTSIVDSIVKRYGKDFKE
jgi:rfaE bifunctional protein nucleotidyltransferase chain/domain